MISPHLDGLLHCHIAARVLAWQGHGTFPPALGQGVFLQVIVIEPLKIQGQLGPQEVEVLIHGVDPHQKGNVVIPWVFVLQQGPAGAPAGHFCTVRGGGSYAIPQDIVVPVQHRPRRGGEVQEHQGRVAVGHHLADVEGGALVCQGLVHYHSAGGEQLLLPGLCPEVVQKPPVQPGHHRKGTGDRQNRHQSCSGQFGQVPSSFHLVFHPFLPEEAL